MNLRAGGLYETSAIPEETQQIDFVSLSRFSLTAGATARWRMLSFTLGSAHFRTAA